MKVYRIRSRAYIRAEVIGTDPAKKEAVYFPVWSNGIGEWITIERYAHHWTSQAKAKKDARKMGIKFSGIRLESFEI